MKNQLIKTLKTQFQLGEFRTGQEMIINKLMGAHSVVVTMPTGSGKSLCYQLPALLLEGVTLVISPLIALMKDQVDSLKKLNIPATFINSTLSSQEATEQISLVKNGKIKLLYVAPERFYSASFIGLLKSVKISLFIVDEAHCISQWGHDFRPSYLRLKNAITDMGNPPVGAFTATATPAVRNDIQTQLGLKKVDHVVTGFDRKNLKYVALSLKTDKEKTEEMLRILSTLGGSGIIYVGTKKLTEQVTDKLRTKGFKAGGYHGGMDKERREVVQNQWINGKTPIIVATNAFGMGIDKSDVRFVVHFSMPGTLEAYMQESGRAGRDGKTSYCVAFSNYSDVRLQEFFIVNAHPPKETIIGIYQFLQSIGRQDIYLTQKEIAEKVGTGIKDSMVASSLAILEKANLLQRLNRHDHHLEIELLNREASVRGSIQKMVFENLLKRMTPGDSAPFKILPEQLEKGLSISHAQLSTALIALDSKSILRYLPPFRGRGVRLFGEKIPVNQLPVDFNLIEEHRQFQMEKLETMKLYYSTGACRRKYLLNYFGETLESENCKGCDICLNWGPKEHAPVQLKPLPVDNEDLVLDILKIVREMKQSFGRDAIAKTLAGSKSKNLPIQLKNHVMYGKYENFTRKFTSSVIDELLGLQYIFRSFGMYPAVYISPQGEDVLKGLAEVPTLNVVPQAGKRGIQSKLKLTESLQMTYELYLENISLEEIAKKRGFVESTIVNHLCILNESDKEIDFTRFISAEKIPVITEAIRKTLKPSLAAIRANIPDDANCTYNDIRMVLVDQKKRK